MVNKEKLVREWIFKAEHDLGMARLALDHKPEYTDSICFHCQQAAEKYIKACLVYMDIDFKKSHSLSYLLDLISEREKIAEEIYSMADQLESYAVKTRYPVEWPEPTLEDAQEAYRYALVFRGFCQEKLGLAAEESGKELEKPLGEG